MKHISILGASLLGLLLLTTSCNDEWEDEQYAHYVAFSAPLVMMVMLPVINSLMRLMAVTVFQSMIFLLSLRVLQPIRRM